jgi:hypothetical protein
MNSTVPSLAGVCIAVLHARFLRLLPKIETHARIVFRGVRCPVKQEDRVQECVALGWKWFLRLSEQGKDVFAFPMAFIALLTRAVKCGRRLCGQERTGDVLSFAAQQRHGFRIERLPATSRSPHEHLYADPYGQALLDAFEERLRDNTLTPIPDQVEFRIDFPAWLRTLTGRERRMVREMAQGERTQDLSRDFDLSPGRVSQLRRAFRDAWLRFHGEQAPGHRRTAAR